MLSTLVVNFSLDNNKMIAEKQLAKASNEFREELRDAELELLHRQLNKYRKEQAARVVTLSRVGIVGSI